jgi:hypothetical protein
VRILMKMPHLNLLSKNLKNTAAISTAVFFFIPSANAWDKHQELMTHLLETKPALTREYLVQKVKIPSSDQQLKTISEVAAEIQVDAKKIPLFSPGRTEMTVNELLASSFVDEPDQGMDQNLPDSADPKGDRPWMGGSTGPTSQGFRHMYFPGIEWIHPLKTLQIPFHSLGQAPDQFRKLIQLSEKKFSQGDLFWGVRTLTWALHLMQDLHQPFHVTQVPYLKMLPWNSLFNGFVAKSTQSIANYHYAYEGLALEYVKDAQVNHFEECFEPIALAPLPIVDGLPDLHDEVGEVRKVAPAIGKALYGVFGNKFKSPEIQLASGIGSVDYYSITHAAPALDGEKGDNPEMAERGESIEQLRSLTCELMKRVSTFTWSEIDRAFHFKDNSINTGK